MNKQVIVGVIFLLIWIMVMIVWGASKNFTPDYSSDYQEVQQDGGSGHPLWND